MKLKWHKWHGSMDAAEMEAEFRRCHLEHGMTGMKPCALS